jgi:hypothetical protein
VKITRANGWFDAALIIFASLTGFFVSLHIAFAARTDGAPVAVVFAPWVEADRAVAMAAAAGATILSVGASANVVIVRPDDAAYADRVRREGAWLVADAAALTGCPPDVTP